MALRAAREMAEAGIAGGLFNLTPMLAGLLNEFVENFRVFGSHITERSASGHLAVQLPDDILRLIGRPHHRYHASASVAVSGTIDRSALV